MTDIFIEGGRALLGEEFEDASVRTSGWDIGSVGTERGHRRGIRAR